MEIPKQLQNERFILVNNHKQPIEKDWTNTANYNYQEITQKQIKTYGVLCGKTSELMVVDCDKKEIQEKLMQLEIFRNTFIVQTAGKKLYHFYFFAKNTPERHTTRYKSQ